MKKFLVVLSAILLLFGVSGTTLALPNSGEYMFTMPGNDPSNPGADLTFFELDIENWFLTEKAMNVDLTVEFYAKVDEPAVSTTEGSGLLNVGYETDHKSGTWSTADLIDFYSVKAGPQFALYWVDPAATSGTWSTEDLYVGRNGNNPEISHVSTWRIIDGPTPAPVREPATLILFGSGLISLVGIDRKKRQRRNHRQIGC
ncbi:MAG: hypothetical protein JSW39_04050 [Desulfobacterales bacterium]|nr:MAG: hypothetical protein JSW39_04050 [Desulfobacterales bacterium]